MSKRLSAMAVAISDQFMDTKGSLKLLDGKGMELYSNVLALMYAVNKN